MSKRSSLPYIACVVALVLCVALVGCKNQSKAAGEVVEAVMAGYVVPSEDGSGDESSDDSKKSEVEAVEPNYGDDATASILSSLDVNMDDFHKHAFSRFSYSMGEPVVADDKKSAQVQITITNVSLATAANNAAADFTAYSETDDYQTTFADGGRTPLFAKLVDYLYQHLDSDDLVTTTVSVTVTKDDSGNWTFDPTGNSAFFSALYGGSDIVDGLGAAATATTTAASADAAATATE